ncbi:Nicotinate phosphoribosyltransferase [Neolewinella maritima]|uniref:Nicotinate phosphoribosyltransferase n=1 Tax=Neolewinella maritima TaxID=1383882 RepID=A0ABN8F8D1_9BACT|nr:nicotinate phosphoribosyltransferase [Neolewinella maritima]CAH1001524.1 Nicotinate phosphoribosyltransferase [Neolewinella maritima]
MTTAPLAQVYRPTFGLLTDLYQLTMAAGYYQQGIHERRAVFHLFFRKAPFGERAALAAGLPLAIEIVKGLQFSADDVQYLGRLKGGNGEPLFREPFLNYLQRMKFTGDIDAVPEGEIALPHEPLLRIEGPLIQVQLLETALLNVMNFSTLIATKAARIKAAAGDDRVIEFGLRRAQGIDGGLTASRSAYLGGCDASSNVWAGRYFDVPVRGTHAHSWVMAHTDELSAFEAYAEALPNNCIFLVDTYDTIEGVRNAIRVGKQLRERGHDLRGIRLDSGDLAELSIHARRMLDEAGFPDAIISASDSLDEYAIARLKAAGARITVWGIGTRLATAFDQPALGGVYKLAAIQNAAGEWETKVKRSETLIKVSNPGRLAVRRYYEGDRPVASQLYNTLTGEPSLAVVDGVTVSHSLTGQCTELLQPIFRQGVDVYQPVDLHRTRERALVNWTRWHQPDMDTFVYGLAPELLAEKQALLTTK